MNNCSLEIFIDHQIVLQRIMKSYYIIEFSIQAGYSHLLITGDFSYKKSIGQ